MADSNSASGINTSVIHIILEGSPLSTNSVYKHGRGVSYMTKKGRDLKDSYVEQAKKQFNRKTLLSEPLTISVGVFLGDKRRRDWDNYHKLSMDALNGTVWEDDEQVMVSHVYKLIDTIRPRIELYINKYDESRDWFQHA